ncbi:acyl-coenzyme A synthetase ACSM4, mitochondrial-like isoform X3 [Chiroxiphia lanceolata]|uniref:acyl-coenzyme A synthetase ACSM4, mitochondrial-like isoform X3 n=1 Tax=Chiroxiphia lanceolata TaxID=296741 RepID=UPI0013CE9561|nr:acyl-coenzyme A synthetase ACSM4, mitochondrial-like isoform X3 [Chiroxiphia lanceolata]
MKILLEFQALWSPRSIQTLRRLFHQYHKTFAPLNFSDYEAIGRCEKQVPEYFNFASDVLDKWSQIEKERKGPSNPALWWINGKGDEIKWSFGELGFLSQKVANVLSGPCSLQRGDRVLVILPRIPEWWLLNVACMRTGVIIIPGTTQLTAQDICYRLLASKAKCIITTDALAPAVDSVASKCQFLKTKLIVSESSRAEWLNFSDLLKAAPAVHNCVKTKSQDPMVIYFTSGTTGSPKMVEHSYGSFGLGFFLCGRYWMNLTPSDIMWNMSDTAWVKGAAGSIFGPWSQGTCVFVHAMPQFDPRGILNTLCRYPVTTLCSAPTVYRVLVQHDLSRYAFKTLRHCLTAGEPLNPEVMAQWERQTGLTIYEGYGQTEIIIDENGSVLPPGEEGDIAIKVDAKRPFTFFTRYVGDPVKTASTIRGNFYITGDRGSMDEDGYIWFMGRSDDVIISSGYRIGPFEVESALIEHPAVAEAAVVSSPDPIRGEVVKAFVVLSPSFKSQDPNKLACELQEHVKKVTAPYKYPRKIEFVQQLPKTITGKIRRNELRNKEWRQI